MSTERVNNNIFTAIEFQWQILAKFKILIRKIDGEWLACSCDERGAALVITSIAQTKK